MTSDYPAGPSPEDSIGEQTNDDDGPAFPSGTDRTGDTSVDAMIVRLAGIPELPIDEHNTLYTGVHDGLFAELNADPPADHDAS